MAVQLGNTFNRTMQELKLREFINVHSCMMDIELLYGQPGLQILQGGYAVF